MPNTLGEDPWCTKHQCGMPNGCPKCAEELDTATRSNEVEKVIQWLKSADAGAMFGSRTWGVRQDIASALEDGLHRNWRSRVDSTY